MICFHYFPTIKHPPHSYYSTISVSHYVGNLFAKDIFKFTRLQKQTHTIELLLINCGDLFSPFSSALDCSVLLFVSYCFCFLWYLKVDKCFSCILRYSGCHWIYRISHRYFKAFLANFRHFSNFVLLHLLFVNVFTDVLPSHHH